MNFIRIVQQPAVASVVVSDRDGLTAADRGNAVILYQHTRERCAGYLCGFIDGRDGAPTILPPARCLPGDSRKMRWIVEQTEPSPTFSPKEPHWWLGVSKEELA